jgi:hypothetical protein
MIFRLGISQFNCDCMILDDSLWNLTGLYYIIFKICKQAISPYAPFIQNGRPDFSTKISDMIMIDNESLTRFIPSKSSALLQQLYF